MVGSGGGDLWWGGGGCEIEKLRLERERRVKIGDLLGEVEISDGCWL